MNPGHNPPPAAGEQPGRMFGTVTGAVRLAATHAAAATDDGTGGGFWSAMRICPERRLAVVAMAITTAKWDDRLFTRLKDLSWS